MVDSLGCLFQHNKSLAGSSTIVYFNSCHLELEATYNDLGEKFNPEIEGHLILHNLKLAIEFPAVLISSSTMNYDNNQIL